MLAEFRRRDAMAGSIILVPALRIVGDVTTHAFQVKLVRMEHVFAALRGQGAVVESIILAPALRIVGDATTHAL